MGDAPRGEIADARWFSKEEFLVLPFPEKGTLWDELNHSALDAEAALESRALTQSLERLQLDFPKASGPLS